MDADLLVDRRRNRKKLIVWRAIAFVLAATVLFLGFALLGGEEGWRALHKPHIARISISGVIFDERERNSFLRALAEDDAVKGIILAVDSPGGTTTGSETLYKSLRILAEKKPMVAVIESVAASGGYMAVLAADRILAHHTSMTGSIGVYYQYANAAPLLDTLGISVKMVKSAPLKGEPSPFTPGEVPGTEEMLQALVNDSYQWFVGLLRERRKLTTGEALRLANGAIYSGERAVENKLADALGGEIEAVSWLEEERGVPEDLPVLDREPGREGTPFGFLQRALSFVASLVGVDLMRLTQQPVLDGLVSIWHPDFTQ